MISNRAWFVEDSHPYRNQDIIEGKLAQDNNLEILSQRKPLINWIDFTPETNLAVFEQVTYFVRFLNLMCI